MARCIINRFAPRKPRKQAFSARLAELAANYAKFRICR